MINQQLNVVFLQKKKMKNLLLTSLTALALMFLLSSCGVYHEPCEGVGQANSVNHKSY